LFEDGGRRSGKNDAINVKRKTGSGVTMMKNEKGCIRFSFNETNGSSIGSKAMKPC
jgi:hypothetical protein